MNASGNVLVYSSERDGDRDIYLWDIDQQVDDDLMYNEILRSGDDGATWKPFFLGEFIRKHF